MWLVLFGSKFNQLSLFLLLYDQNEPLTVTFAVAVFHAAAVWQIKYL